MARALLLALTAFAAASPVLAQEQELDDALAQALSQCVPGDPPVAGLPVDLGDGVVAQELFPGTLEFTPHGVTLITDCASGVRIVAAMPPLEGGEQRTFEDVVTFMSNAMGIETVLTLGEVTNMMTAAGAPAQVRQTSNEDCGCAQLYPDLRGDKAPWEGPTE